MKNTFYFKAFLWKLLSALLAIVFLPLPFIYLSKFVAHYNFEELSLLYFFQTVFQAFLAGSFIFQSSLFLKTKLDFSKNQIHYRKFLHKKDISFEGITAFYFREDSFTEHLTVFTSDGKYEFDKRYLQYFREFHDWLKENKPIHEIKNKTKGCLLLVVLWIPITTILIFPPPIADDLRYILSFDQVQTVEMEGIVDYSYDHKTKKEGFYKLSLELKEYPDLKFQASEFLPDEVVDLDALEKGSLVVLTVNKEDYEKLIVRGKSDLFFLVKHTVRTYEVRTDEKVFLKKDLTLLQ